jgi:hypothetical protein
VPKPEIAAQSSAQHGNKPAAQKYFNFAIIVIMVLQTGVFIWTVKAINNQTRTTRLNERPWISVDLLGMVIPDNLDATTKIVLSPRVTNHGRTPARILGISSRPHALPQNGKLPPVPEYKKAKLQPCPTAGELFPAI